MGSTDAALRAGTKFASIATHTIPDRRVRDRILEADAKKQGF
jgi:hypothetical protein